MAISSGLYEGDSQGAIIHLRVDRSGLRIISGDVFQKRPTGAVSTLSLVTRSPLTLPPNGPIDESVVIHWAPPKTGTGTGRMKLTEMSTVDGVERLLIELDAFSFGGVVASRFEAIVRKVSDSCRRVEIEIDIEKGAADNPILMPAEFDDQKNQFKATLNSMLTRTGVEPIFVGNRTVIPANPDDDGVWTEEELLSAMQANFDNNFSGMSWRMYLFLASRHRDPSTKGIMFDRAKRRGAAIFYYSLQDQSKSSGLSFERDYLRTLGHEIGHLFNLQHAFEFGNPFGQRAASFSYMNYPHAHPNGPTAYFSGFNWTFERAEAMFLLHGPFNQVVMGGSTFGSSGSADVACDPENAGSMVNGISLALRLSPADRGQIFQFGEPVVVEAKLANRSGEPRTARDTLAPQHRETEFVIEGPHGRQWKHSPFFTRCAEHRSMELAPATEDDRQRKAIYEAVNLSFDARGFRFVEPGKYTIQAVHWSVDGPIYSNLQTVFIRHPDEATENRVVPLLDDDVATFLGMRGAPDLLPNVEKKFEKATNDEEFPLGDHPLVDDFARCKFHLFLGGYRTIDCSKRSIVRKEPGIDEKLEKTVRAILRIPPTSRARNASIRIAKRSPNSSLANLVYGQLAKAFLRHLNQKPAAKASASKAILNYLTDRGLPSSFAADYQAEEAD